MQFKQLLHVFYLLVLCFFVMPAMAQNKVISGNVTDKSDGTPLIGVSISTASNTGQGTISDVNGNYKISVPEETKTLVFTYLGYNKQVVSIAGKSSVSVILETNSSNLNEVVVIGYGTQRIKDATGSVSYITSKDFNKGVIATPEQLLQGRIAGVQVTPASGEPGAGSTINIRGSSSIRSNNTPLYVVDGVPLDNGGTSGGLDGGSGTSSAGNPLAFLNPNDIESFNVLKDPSAIAVYGSRGANGVIMITTKKGTKGQGITFSATTSASNVAKRYDLLDREGFLAGVTKAGGDAAAVDFKGNTNWQDQIFRTGISQNYNLGFGGASTKSTYRASVGYDDQSGTIKKSNLQRLTGRFNGSTKFLDDKLRLDLQSTFSNVKKVFAPISDNSGFQGSLIGATLQANPTFPITNPDGSYFSPGGDFRNPAALLDLIDDKDNINRFLNNITASYNLTNNLVYRGNYGLDYSSGQRNTFLDPRLPGYTSNLRIRELVVSQTSGNGLGILQNIKQINQITEHNLTYDKKFENNSSLNLLGGYSYQSFKTENYNKLGYETKTPNILIKDVDAFKKQTPVFGDSTISRLQSYLGRANYIYKEKYYLTATVRVDGSSKFGKNNRYATFPAFGFKWNLLNEDFGPKNIFDQLSLRLNYGLTGNQELPPYSSQGIQQRNLDGSTTILTASSPNLKWETTTAYGAGIDFAILKNKLSGTIDYFNKSTKDLLFVQDYPQPSAIPRRFVNLDGTVVNKGVELGLNLQAVQNTKFTWEVLYNATFLDNKIEDFGGRNVITGNIDGQGLSGAYAQTFTNNSPLFSFKVPVWGGFDANGFSTYPNGDEGTIMGSPIPTFTTGLTNNFTFGKFNASIFINASTGFYIYNNTANAYFLKGNLITGRNVTNEVGNSIENPINSGEVSTRFLEKGDFVRLSNVSLGYTFDLKQMKAIKTLRLSVSGQNLALITNYSGLDPEVNTNKARNSAGNSDPNFAVPSRGIDYTPYPSARIFTFGINAGF